MWNLHASCVKGILAHCDHVLGLNPYGAFFARLRRMRITIRKT